MPEYRAYTVGLEGRLVHYEPLACTNDAEAIIETNRLLRAHDMELWRGARLVTRLQRRANERTR
jgi:hypothetical protein